MLLCRHDVRRSMAFSAVQISMPGISCACTTELTHIASTLAATNIRITIFSLACQTHDFAWNWRCFQIDTILRPQSRIEVPPRDPLLGRSTEWLRAKNGW